MPTMITTGRTIPAPYLPRPAGRPSTASAVKASKPGDKVNRKPAFQMNLASYDWRAEVMATAGQPRSLPVNSSKGVMMIPPEAIRPRSFEPEREAGEEVGLEALIEEGKGRREKRATTATALGFDFIANPSITALPDGVDDTAHPATAARAKATPMRPATAELAATPQTPGLLPQRDDVQEDEDEDEEEDDGWERVSAYCDDEGTAGGVKVETELDDDLIVLGELELEDSAGAAEVKTQDRRAEKARGKVSYAAALGQAA